MGVDTGGDITGFIYIVTKL